MRAFDSITSIRMILVEDRAWRLDAEGGLYTHALVYEVERSALAKEVLPALKVLYVRVVIERDGYIALVLTEEARKKWEKCMRLLVMKWRPRAKLDVYFEYNLVEKL
jgi:hypothetical protein